MSIDSGPRFKFKNLEEEDDTLVIEEVRAMRISYFRTLIVAPLLTICTGMIFGLLLYWFPSVQAKTFYVETSDLRRATHMLVRGIKGNVDIVKLENEQSKIQAITQIQQTQYSVEKPLLIFEYRFQKYEFNHANQTFEPIIFNCSLPYKEILDNFSGGVSSDNPVLGLNLILQKIKYGICDIIIPINSIPQLLVKEVLNPFYLFQIFSFSWWYWEMYYYFASCLVFLSLVALFVALFDTIMNLRRIQEMAHYVCQVKALRVEGSKRAFATIQSDLLVPGDIIQIPDQTVIPCDIILLKGVAVMNESMLTGESIPAIKNPIPPTSQLYDRVKDAKYTLYGGTKVVQARKEGNEEAYGLIIRTGFQTTKGGLIRDILYPRPNRFSFFRDSLLYIAIFLGLAVIGWAVSIQQLIDLGFEDYEIVQKTGDLITIAVPPTLPAAMTIGTSFSLWRLRKKGIFCISPPRVNVSGRVNVMVLDKTGTLTEDGLQVFGFRNLKGADVNALENAGAGKPAVEFDRFHEQLQFLIPEDHGASYFLSNETYSKCKNRQQIKLLEAMGACHQITFVKDELIGDPLDVRMFQATKWILNEDQIERKSDDQEIPLVRVHPEIPEVDSKQPKSALKDYIGILRRFEFESGLQRMSVVVRNYLDEQNPYHYFVKGSPEKIKELSIKASLPSDFDEILDDYTQRGYRVIALAHRAANGINYQQIQTMGRDEVEKNLNFLGFLIMQNKLKGATVKSIFELNEADIRTIMATGDNMLTAISVARKCGIIKEEQVVYLADLIADGPSQGITWKIAKDSDAVQQDHNQPKEAIKNMTVAKLLPWEKDAEEGFAIAITGKAFNYLVNDAAMKAVLQQVILRGQVFARMTPEDKATLVEQLQFLLRLDIGMCGDGANDCNALKTADTGISLSDSEASIAAPFTSKIQDISCISVVLREGRSALTTSFQIFKYMGLYAMIQFMTVVLMYQIGSNLSDFEFLWEDLAMAVPICFVMGATPPSDTLSKLLPEHSLLGIPTIVSVLGSTAIQLGVQLPVFIGTKNNPFNERAPIDPEDRTANWPCDANTVLFQISVFQLIVTSIAFSVSHPFRKPMYQNWMFVFFIFANTFFAFYFINLNEHQWVSDVFFLLPIPGSFRHWLLLIVFGNSLITYVYEKVIVSYISIWDQARLERKRVATISKEVAQARADIDLFFALKNQKEDAYIGNNDNSQSSQVPPKHQITARKNAVHAEENIDPEGEHYGGIDEKVKASVIKA